METAHQDNSATKITVARWNTNPMHSVGFYDCDRTRRMSELLAAATEYLEQLEQAEPDRYLVHDVRLRQMRHDGTQVLELDILEIDPEASVEVSPERLEEARGGLARSAAEIDQLSIDEGWDTDR